MTEIKKQEQLINWTDNDVAQQFTVLERARCPDMIAPRMFSTELPSASYPLKVRAMLSEFSHPRDTARHLSARGFICCASPTVWKVKYTMLDECAPRGNQFHSGGSICKR